jgi:hypothetical protein
MAQKLEETIGQNSVDLKHYTYIFEPKKYFKFPIYSVSYKAQSQIEQKEGAIQPMPMIRGLKNITKLIPRKTPDVDNHINRIHAICFKYAGSDDQRELGLSIAHNQMRQCVDIWIVKTARYYMDGLRWIFYKREGKDGRGKMEDFAAKRLKTYTAIVRRRFRLAQKKVTTKCTAPFVLMNSRVYVCQDWSVSPINTYFKLMGNEGRVLRIPEISSVLK